MRVRLANGARSNSMRFPVLMVLVVLAELAYGACGPVPATYPLSTGAELDIKTGVTINGHAVADGKTGADSVVDINGNRLTVSQTLPDVEPDPFPENSVGDNATDADSPFVSSTTLRYRDVTIRRDRSASFSGGGPFHIRKLKMEQNATLNLAAGIYFIETLDMKGDGARINVTSEPVILHIGKEFKTDADDLIINGAGTVAGLQVMLHTGAEFNRGAKGKRMAFTGLVFGSANNEAGIGEDAQFHGAVIGAGKITVKDNVAMTYDAADQAAVGAVPSCYQRLCEDIPGDHPLYSSAEVDVKTGVTLNGTGVVPGKVSPDAALQMDGTLQANVGLVLPDLVPPSFPVNTSGTNVTVPDDASQSFTSSTDVYYKKIDVGKRATVTFSGGGPFHIQELTLEEDAVANLAAGTYYIDKLRLHGDRARINVTSAPVVVHIGTEVNAHAANPVLNQGGQVAGLILFMHGGAKVKETGDGFDFTGLIYGPNAGEVKIGTSASIHGAIITGGKIRVGEGATLSYTVGDQILVNGIGTCVTGILSHFLLSHDGYGINCLAESVGVTPITLGGTAFTGYAGTVRLTTQTSTGGWLGTTDDGTLTDPDTTDGVATYAFSGNESFPVQFTLAYPEGPASVDLDVYQSDAPTLRDDDSETPIGFSPNGFTVTAAPLGDPPGTIGPVPAQTAGAPFSLYLTAYGQTPGDPTCGVIEAYEGDKDIQLWSSYDNPGTGTLSVSVAGNPIATSEGGSSTQTITFTQGQSAGLNTKYKDVGRIQIEMKDDTVADPELPNGIRGTTSLFVVKPAAFELSNIERSSDSFANPGASDETGPVFIGAGDEFSVTVTAKDAEGDATPNYGQESPAEGVKLTSTLVDAGAANNPPIGSTSGFDPFSGGSATGTDFHWDEVGIITAIPGIADGSYLGAGDVTGPTSENIGRFTPYEFDVSLNTPQFGTACGSFSYIGQPFTYNTRPVITVTARAKPPGSSTTRNYTGAYWMITDSKLTASGNKTYAAATGTLDIGLVPTPDPVIVDNGDGTGTLTFSDGGAMAFNRGAPQAPFDADIALSIHVIDEDNIAHAANPVSFGAPAAGNGMAFDSGKAMRWGRVALTNAAGSELIGLSLPTLAQYHNGTGFVVNSLDGCSRFATGDVTLSNRDQPGETDGDILISGSLSTYAIGNTPFVAGNAGVSITSPGAGNTGYADVVVDLSAGGADRYWLQFDWDGNGSHDNNPGARATFGIYLGSPRLIYIRDPWN